MHALRRLQARLVALDPFGGDGLLAIVLAVIGLVGLATSGVLPGSERREATVVAYGLGLVLTLPIALRRRHPLGVLVIVVSAAVAYEASRFPLLTLDVFGVLIAFYTVVVHGDRTATRLAVAIMALFVVVLILVEPAATRAVAGDLLSHGAILAGTWLVAHNVRVRREQAAELERRARQLEEAREELARKALADERLRIARELHDVVAHSVSVIAVQSGAGRLVSHSHPEEAARALASIEGISRSALHELRRLLGVLRQDGQPQGSLVPAPALSDLDALLARVADAGLQVELVVEGATGKVPVGVDLSAYRIVQEALTNVIKHAGSATATVRVCCGEREVCVEVTDMGTGLGASGNEPPALPGGNGLIGMRERVAVYGGEFSAGPRPEGGFRVAARLPFEEP